MAAKYREDDLEVMRTKRPMLQIVELFPNRHGEPVWYVARPDIAAPAGSAEGRAALAAASRPELTGGASVAASVLDVATGTARGGASGEW